jgi:preflagellin peptidase FlaK
LLTIISSVQVTLTLAFLIYSSWSDYKSREVRDLVWAVFAPIALSLSLLNFLFFEPSKLALFGLSAAISIGFSFLIFFLNGFGGADFKAFVCIALALPFFPTDFVMPVFSSGISPLSQILFPITVLSNTVLISALSALFLLFWNIGNRIKNKSPFFQDSLAKETLAKRIIVLITGKKFSIIDLKAKWHIYPLEDITKENNFQIRKLVIVPKDEGRDEIVERLSLAINKGKIDSKVWATPGLPMLIFVTLGLVVALAFGDIIWIIVTNIFSSIV